MGNEYDENTMKFSKEEWTFQRLNKNTIKKTGPEIRCINT